MNLEPESNSDSLALGFYSPEFREENTERYQTIDSHPAAFFWGHTKQQWRDGGDFRIGSREQGRDIRQIASC